MNLKEYQKFCLTTAVYPKIGKNWHYPLIGLTGELGELANVLKKVIRDDHDKITPEKFAKIFDEMGDIFWYLVMLCYELGIDPDKVLKANKKKLKKRKKTNTIHDIGRKKK